MPEKVTLKDIINRVLDDIDEKNHIREKYNRYENYRESSIRKLYRKMNDLFEALGSNKEVLKDGGTRMEFDELDVPVIKVLITQLYTGQGIIAEFVNSRKNGTKFSSNDVIKFIQTLCDEVAKDDRMNEEDLQYLAQFFSNIFLYSPLRSLETCHAMIDTLAINLQDLPCDKQSIYLGRIEHILKKEVALRIAESTIATLGIAEIATLQEDAFYCEYDPEIKFYYIQRDQQVLKAIQEDEDLRQYIEKKLGRKAETIFNYATLESN